MPEQLQAFVRGSKKLGILGFGSLAVAAACIGLSSATASAEIVEISPEEPIVTSRQATLISEDAVRQTDIGDVLTAQGDARNAPITEVRGQDGGEVRDTVKAVPGSVAGPFEGAWPTSPALGDFS